MAGREEKRKDPVGRRADDYSLRAKLTWAKIGYFLLGLGLLVALLVGAYNYGRVQQQQHDNAEAIARQEDKRIIQDEKIAKNCTRIAVVNGTVSALIGGLISSHSVEGEVKTRLEVAQESLEAQEPC